MLSAFFCPFQTNSKVQYLCMNLPENISLLLSHPMSIYPNAIEGIIGEILAHRNTEAKVKMPTASIVATAKGNVLVIPVQKFISKVDIPQYGIIGTSTIQRLIEGVAKDPSIIGVVLHINNPGGTVLNTTETARQIFNFSKPIVAFVEDLAASSGFYLASACKYIFVSGPSAVLGNIGTKSSGIDYQGIFEKLGAKSWEIYSSESYNKDLGFTKALAGDPADYQAMILDPYSNLFMNDVRQFRPQIAEADLHGNVYLGDTAIEKGMADAIGTLDDAIMKVQELSKQTSNNKKSNTMSKITMSVPAEVVGAVKALGGEEVTAQKVEGGEDLKQAFEALKTSHTAEKSRLTNEIETLKAENTGLKTEKATLTSKVDELNAEMTTIKATTAGASPATPPKIGNDIAPDANLKNVDPLVASAEAKLQRQLEAHGIV